MSRLHISKNTTLPTNILFDLSGSLITSRGDVPNYKRGSLAYIPYVENGNIAYKDFFAHQVRISNDGNILLEKEATNLLTDSLSVNSNQWTRGSSVTIVSDIGGGSNLNFLADLINFATIPNSANPATNRLFQNINLMPGYTYCLSAYINLRSDRFSEASYLGVFSGSQLLGRINLNYWFEDVYTDKDKYVPLYCTFRVDGDLLDESRQSGAGAIDNLVPIRIELFCDIATTLYWGGAQIEEGPYPTSFIDPAGNNTSRAADSLIYEKSPYNGLQSFSSFIHLDRWAGDGRILETDNFSMFIQDSRLNLFFASANLVDRYTFTERYILGQNTDILVTLKDGRNLKVYVDGELRGSQTLPFTYTGTNSNLIIGGEGVRSFNNLFVFDQEIDDKDTSLLSFARGGVASIFSKRFNLPISEGIGSIVFPVVNIPARGRASVRLPQTRFASQMITGMSVATVTTRQSLVFECVNNVAGTASIGLDLGSGIINANFTASGSHTINQIVQGVGDLLIANSTLNSALEITYSVTIPTFSAGDYDNTEFSTAFSRPITGTSTSGMTSILVTKRNASGPAITFTHSPHFVVRELVPHSQTHDFLTVNNAFDFRLGDAQVLDGYNNICDVIISDIETDRIHFFTEPASFSALIQPNRHTLFQSSWKTEIAPINYISDHLENYQFVTTKVKAMDGFVLENSSNSPVTVTPHVTVLL